MHVHPLRRDHAQRQRHRHGDLPPPDGRLRKDGASGNHRHALSAEQQRAQRGCGPAQSRAGPVKEGGSEILHWESAFDTDLLKDMLAENKAAIAEAEATISESQLEKELEDSRLQYISEQYSHISDWASEFDHASTDKKDDAGTDHRKDRSRSGIPHHHHILCIAG